MILGMPAPLFWHGVALLASAGAIVGLVVAWIRLVSRDADLGARWVNNCGSREKAVALLVAYEKMLDAKLARGLRGIAAEEMARDDKLGEQMLRDALTDPFQHLREGKEFPDVIDVTTITGPRQTIPRSSMFPDEVPCCARGGPNPHDTQ
jgi:hypothetical protein